MYTWEEIEEHVNSCAACPLCRTRKHPVMGRGDHKGKLMLVAEAPACPLWDRPERSWMSFLLLWKSGGRISISPIS